MKHIITRNTAFSGCVPAWRLPLAEGLAEAFLLLCGVKLRPGMLLAVQVEGQSVDVKDALLIVEAVRVRLHPCRVESPLGVKLVQGLFVFGSCVGADRQDRAVGPVVFLQAVLDVGVFASLCSLHFRILRFVFFLSVVY